MKSDCPDCPLPSRRDFLQGAAVAAMVLALPGVATGELPLRLATSSGRRGDDVFYPFPITDGVTIDKDNGVIVARAGGIVWAFSLTCPHQNTALKWLDDDHRFQCPKHKSKYQPDGTFISGRATRNMDRFKIRREGEKLVVNLTTLYRQDQDQAGWAAAAIAG